MADEISERQAERYLEALKHIVNILGPVNDHIDESITCSGCLYDWEECLVTAQCALSGEEYHD